MRQCLLQATFVRVYEQGYNTLTKAMKRRGRGGSGEVGSGELEVHKGTICDGCSMDPIRGPRYKSRDCEDFDLCGVCHEDWMSGGSQLAQAHCFKKMSAMESEEEQAGAAHWKSTETFRLTVKERPANRSAAKITYPGYQNDDADVCWISFPGKYKGEGRHEPDPDNEALCLCHRIYGQSQSWGCYWYKAWKDNVHRAIGQKQRLKAVFFAGQVGRGKVSMKDLPTENLWDGIGLGGSQKAELATADEEGWDYDEVDVATVLLGAFPEGAQVDAWCDADRMWRRGRVAKFKKDVNDKGQEQVSWMVCCETGETIDTQYVMDAAIDVLERS
ncbi:HERC2 [Symbiodinium microadriaticum]|nr:HERC2 [Symbiodinium microadriaticum]